MPTLNDEKTHTIAKREKFFQHSELSRFDNIHIFQGSKNHFQTSLFTYFWEHKQGIFTAPNRLIKSNSKLPSYRKLYLATVLTWWLLFYEVNFFCTKEIFCYIYQPNMRCRIWKSSKLVPLGGVRGENERWGSDDRSFVNLKDNLMKFGVEVQNRVQRQCQNDFPPAAHIGGISQHWLVLA